MTTDALAEAGTDQNPSAESLRSSWQFLRSCPSASGFHGNLSKWVMSRVEAAKRSGLRLHLSNRELKASDSPTIAAEISTYGVPAASSDLFTARTCSSSASE